MATPSSIVEPQQQQAGSGEIPANSAYSSSSSSAWKSSGSVGPFFAVISVLAILAILSCYLARRLNGRAPTPLESITGGRGFFGWVRRMCRHCRSNDVEVGGVGAKVVACNNIENDNNNEPKVDQQ